MFTTWSELHLYYTLLFVLCLALDEEILPRPLILQPKHLVIYFSNKYHHLAYNCSCVF